MTEPSRRQFLKTLATAAGAVVLVPAVARCGGTTGAARRDEGGAAMDAALAVPKTPGAAWDAVAFNTARGNAGAIPVSYQDDINGPSGVDKHLGKHLPYQPKVDPKTLPAGFLALMWGNPAKGYAKHPNAARGPANGGEGHWYNWIKVRKATEGEAEEATSTYAEWPGTDPASDGYAVFGGGALTDDGGRNTIYLAALPSDVQPGDTVRIWAHCLTHGEYVDFLTV